MLGSCFVELGRFEEVELLLVDAYERLTESSERADDLVHNPLAHVVELYEAWGKPNRLKEYEARLTTAEAPSQ